MVSVHPTLLSVSGGSELRVCASGLPTPRLAGTQEQPLAALARVTVEGGDDAEAGLEFLVRGTVETAEEGAEFVRVQWPWLLPKKEVFLVTTFESPLTDAAYEVSADAFEAQADEDVECGGEASEFAAFESCGDTPEAFAGWCLVQPPSSSQPKSRLALRLSRFGPSPDRSELQLKALGLMENSLRSSQVLAANLQARRSGGGSCRRCCYFVAAAWLRLGS